MFNKIYIHAPGLERPDEIKKYSYLLYKNDPYTIWDSGMQMGRDNTGKIYDVGVLEVFLFHAQLRAEGYRDDQIEIIQDQPLFFHNDELFLIQNGVRSHVDTQNVGFFSLRPNSWRHPFFFLLREIIEQKGGKMKRTNALRNEIHGKGKFYGLQNLMKEREKNIGELLVMYGVRDEVQIEALYQYIVHHFSPRVVAKKDYGCAGKTVFVMDLRKNDEKQKDRLIEALKGHEGYTSGVYLTAYQDFEEEYRFYFNKRNGSMTLHSMKTKKILSDFDHIVSCDTFQYYKNIALKWQYVPNEDWETKYAGVVGRAYEYLSKLDYTTGTLEFGKTKDGKYVFFEVNSMSATLCFGGEDTKNMQGYYEGIFQNLLFDA